MSRQREARLQARIVRALKAAGYTAAYRLRPLGVNGWPDLYIVHEGRAYHLEVKMPGERPTPLQLHVMGQLRAAGAVVAVVESVEGALSVMRGEKP